MGKLREPLEEIGQCGLPLALEAMGERWSFMILRAAFNGFRHFDDFFYRFGFFCHESNPQLNFISFRLELLQPALWS